MGTRFVYLLVIAVCFSFAVSAQVKFTKAPHGVDVAINGAPFTSYYAGGDSPKPYLHPLRTHTGLVITRGYPMLNVPGETKDHPHHRGLWFTHGDVNKIDFWMNEPGNKGVHGPIELVKIDSVKDGKNEGTIVSTFLWKTAEGTPLLDEKRTMTFVADPKLRIMDFDVSFTGRTKITWGDTKEGFFAIRLRDELTQSKGKAVITNSRGGVGMKETWGKQAEWVDYAGTAEGQKVGVAIFDHPGNFLYPTYWHVRDYGLFAANPFGLHDFYNDKTKDGSLVKESGQPLRLRYRVVIHDGDTAEAGIAKMYEGWVKGVKR
jgi:hypothetical protein